MNKISAVYQIINTVTGDRYVGSSKDVKNRWQNHKCPSIWKQHPNSKLYKDFQKYGIDKFRFQILTPVEPEYLKQVEQEFIEMLKPVYNNYMAKGQNAERYKYKEYNMKYRKKHYNQPCLYNGETLTLNALTQRFRRAGIEHPDIEAKKYLVTTIQQYS